VSEDLSATAKRTVKLLLSTGTKTSSCGYVSGSGVFLQEGAKQTGSKNSKLIIVDDESAWSRGLPGGRRQ
jgi:hypothetical protein